MDGVVVGVGKLSGHGVYAARDFAAGDVVVGYHLAPLSRAEYRALADGEDLFVHSYGGRRYLYPAPARFVNHSDDPSCYQDFDRRCNIALRPVVAGEAITIDAAQETARELSTFLDAYRSALRNRSASALNELTDDTATLWLRHHNCRGRNAVVNALLDHATPLLSGVEWLLGHRPLGCDLLSSDRNLRRLAPSDDDSEDHRGQLADHLSPHRVAATRSRGRDKR